MADPGGLLAPCSLRRLLRAMRRSGRLTTPPRVEPHGDRSAQQARQKSEEAVAGAVELILGWNLLEDCDLLV